MPEGLVPPRGSERAISRMRSDQRGNVAMVFGFALLPLVITAGGAIDYARAVEKRTAIQKALDAGVLASATHRQPSSSYLQNKVNAILLSHKISVANATLTTTTSASGGTVYVGDAQFAIDTRFLKIIGVPTISVAAHAEAQLPAQIVTVTFTPTNTQGAYSKDIFIWTKDASGAVTSRQTVLTYRYDAATLSSVTTPPIGSQTVTFAVAPYSTFGIGMVAYQDLSYSGALINPTEMWTDAPNVSTFIHKTGDCSTAAGEAHNWEDGGDSNYVDFVYTMRCTKGVVAGSVARLAR